MYYHRSFFIFLLVAICQLVHVESHLLREPLPKPKSTCAPADIVSHNAEFVNTAFPLTISPQVAEIHVLKNTGKSVIVKPVLPSKAKMWGGVLGNETYVFCVMTFYWNDNATKNGLFSFTTIDGKEGSRVEALVTYYNRKYGTCDEAKKHRDGLAQIAVRANVLNSQPNPLFYACEKILKGIRKAGRRDYALNLLTYIWFANFPLTSKYYIYPGFFTDEETGKKYPATTIVFPLLSLNYISQNQFKNSFGLLENYSGIQTSNAEKSCYSVTSPTIKKANGIKIIYF